MGTGPCRRAPLAAGAANDISDDDPETTFGYVAGKLGDHRLAYLHIVNPALAAIEQGTEPDPRALRMVELIRERYRGPLIMAGGFDHDTAETWLKQGKADLIAFGRKFLANPDLPERFRRRAPSTPMIGPHTTAAAPKGIPTTRPSPRNGARNLNPAWTTDGDDTDTRPSRSRFMKAYELQASFGIDSLTLIERPEPRPGAEQTPLRMRVRSLNSRDLMVVKGTYHRNEGVHRCAA